MSQQTTTSDGDLSRTEHCILQFVTTSRCPLNWLVPEEAELGSDDSAWEFPRQEILTSFKSLIERGDVEAYKLIDRREYVRFVPSNKELEAELASATESPLIYYGLSAQGGSRWEIASNVNWNRFFIESSKARESSDGSVNVVEITSVDPGVIERWLQTKIFPILSPHGDMISPWQVTYWKSLPMAHRLRYQTSSDVDVELLEHARGQMEVLAEIGDWYTDPWGD